MKKKKYLPLYKKWLKLGKLTTNGLCGAFCCFDHGKWIYYTNPKFEYFQLFIPEDAGGYWGAEKETFESFLVFTPLRQNIVLFMAAMNNEL